MKSVSHLLLILIITLGIFLRIVFLDFAPPALNIDEAALGYNAYSILLTGKDEHGVFFPISLESFGDWKLPVYSYITTIPISIFGLNEFSTRLPSILSGILGVIIIYLITQKLFKKNGISLLSSFFFAVSPWSIYFSRAAYEVNLATTIFLLGMLFFLYALDSRKKILLVTSGILFGLTLFTYHSYIIFTSLFSLFLIAYYFKKIKLKVLYFILPLLLFVIASIFSNLSGGVIKASNTTIFNNENILHERVNKFRKDTIGANLAVFDTIHTRYVGVPYQVAQNYLNSFSPSFLFDKGGEKLVHNSAGFGNLYILDSLFIIVGFLFIFIKKEKFGFFLIAWLLLAPIPSSVTLDSPNSTRLFILMPILTILSAYGCWELIKHLRKRKIGQILLVVIFCVYIVNIYYFLNLYFIHLQYHRASFWRYGYEELVNVTNNYPRNKVVMQGVYEFPYIYFLFYNSYDPKKFQEEVEYYQTNFEGFKHVKSFGRYKFVEALANEKEIPGILYIDTQNFHDGDNIIRLPGGDPIFKYYMKE